MTEPHEYPRFYNSVQYTVAVTFTVRGGRRYGTADRQARKIAEPLASHAARMVGVVAVHATASPSRDGQITSPRMVHFDAASTGDALPGQPRQLARYLDPDHELAVRSLTAADGAAQDRHRADHKRRLGAGCHNASVFASPHRYCICVYCAPDCHYDAVVAVRANGHSPCNEYRCVRGEPVAALHERCNLHHLTTIVVLDDDPPTLQLIAGAQLGTQP